MSPEARVGLLVLAGLLILVYLSLKIGKLGFGPGGGFLLHLELDNAVGLTQEGEVLVAGIPVGVVEQIRLVDSKAVLTLRIQDDVVLPVDSTASLRTQGVLGEKYVEIQPGSSVQPLRDGNHLRPGIPPADLDRLGSRLNSISADVEGITKRLARVFGTPEGEENVKGLLTGLHDAAVGLRGVVTENRETLRVSLENARALTGELIDLVEANRGTLEETLANSRAFTQTLRERAPAIADNLETVTADLGEVVVENRNNLNQTLQNLREVTGKFAATLDAVESLAVAAGSTDGTLGRLIRDDSLYEDLRGTLGALKRLLTRLDQGEGTLGRLLTDETAYAELTGSLENLRSISEKVNRGEGTLGKLVNEQSVHENLNDTLEGITDFVAGANRFQFELGYAGEFLVQAGEVKSYFSLELRPRPDRFYYVALVDDQDDEDDGLEFSAQVGKQFSFLTLRGGIFESTGGGGVDVDLWADRLRLTFEAFDLSRNGGPHLKLTARWTLLKHVFVTAGLDDFMDDRGRADYIVGGGIQFLDDDIKFLLSPAASAAR
jgi:phospholipid/cholesterol/gamma-HCH transport system substrate-binding protein